MRSACDLTTRVDLPPDALRDTGRVGHQLRELVVDAARRLGHGMLPLPLVLAWPCRGREREVALPSCHRLDRAGATIHKGSRHVRSPSRFPAIDPVLIEIGPFAIRWYALAYIAGLVFGWLYGRRLIADTALWRVPPGDPVLFDDLIVWVAFGIIIGGRLGHVLIYDPGLLPRPSRSRSCRSGRAAWPSMAGSSARRWRSSCSPGATACRSCPISTSPPR